MTTRRQRLFEINMRNAEVAVASYRYGWPIDPVRQAVIAKEIADGITEQDKLLAETLTHESIPKTFASKFNANSPPQVATLLYEILEVPIKMRTPSGAPSAGKEALETIMLSAEEPAKTLARCLRQRKILTKLHEAYITNLAGVKIVRPRAAVSAQISGRWSYRDPALQTTPPRIKPMFVAHPGQWIVAADLSQAELRNMAQLSGCPAMLGAYSRGEDIHAATAESAFGCTPEEAKTKPFRNPAKVVGLGYNYSVLDDEGAAAGLHPQLIAKRPGITIEEVLGAIKRLKRGRPRVQEYKREVLEKAYSLDYVEEPIHNRRRYFWGKVKDTEAFNFSCQGMTGAIVNDAVWETHQRLDHSCEGLLLQRHDELMLGGPDPHRLCKLLQDHLRRTVTANGNTMTYEIDWWVGKRWGDGGAAIEVKDGVYIIAKGGKEYRADTLQKAVDCAIV